MPRELPKPSVNVHSVILGGFFVEIGDIAEKFEAANN
jgi:hypothetical protein